MDEWTVQIVKVRDVESSIEFDFDGNDAVEVYYEVLSENAPALAYGPTEYSVQMAVAAFEPVEALREAIAAEATAAKKAGLPEWPVVSVSVIEWNYFEMKLDDPTYPTVVGVSELADMLDVTRQRASELARSASFPTPFQELASGPVWLEPTVRRFVADWDRRPGRPRKAS